MLYPGTTPHLNQTELPVGENVLHVQKGNFRQCPDLIFRILAWVNMRKRFQIDSWTFNILSPLQSKRLISHSAGLWLLTRTNSASCWLVTHTGTAMIGCLAPGGTPLIVCLAYFLPSFWWHILALILIAQHSAKETAGKLCLCVCMCMCVLHRTAQECVWENKKQNSSPSQTSLLPFPFSFIVPPLFFFFSSTAAQIR